MDVMNTLLAEIIRSLKELQLGFAGELTMSDAMESLMDALYLDKVRSRVAHTRLQQYFHEHKEVEWDILNRRRSL